MTNILIHNNYYRYREKRKQIKSIVDLGDYETARTQLEAAIAEHEAKYPTELINSRLDFNYGEKIILDHVKRHLDTVIEKDDPPYTESSTGQIKHQSDIVKSALETIPKTDYSD